MKYLNLLIALLFLCCSNKDDVNVITVDNSENMEETTDDNNDTETENEWVMVFEDNFDDENLSQWNIWNGGAFNNEIQLYREEQLVVSNGILQINVQREAVTGDTTPFDSNAKNFEYVSGRIESKTKFGPSSAEGEATYRFVSSIKLPNGNGMWPAFWSYGDDWPTNGEIDIIEARGNEPMQFISNIFYGENLGIPDTNNDETTVTYHELDIDLTADFHTYELIWNSVSFEIYFDGELFKRYEANSDNFIAEFFNKKHMLVLNTAVGGLFFPTNSDSADFVDSATMEVDWVRVYKK